jgi:phage shock protein E
MRLITAALVAILCAACGGAEAHPGADANAVVDAGADPRGAVYVDVRRPDEWLSGHIAGAVHIPVQELEQRWKELEQYRDRDIVLYCRTGRRSGIAYDLLRTKGFTRLENGGSLKQVARRGLEISR